MNKSIKVILNSLILILMFGLVSCEDYLDKAAESTVSGEDAFKSFIAFQGFTEELYYCIPDFAKGYWTNSFNWGEDEIMNAGIDYHFVYKIDNGNFWGWQSEHDGWQSGWMDRGSNSTINDDRFNKSLYSMAWYGIRVANMGIENLEKLKDATNEERNLVAGQLYFFRGWFHFQLMQYFGGLPYIDHVLPAGEKLTLPRLSYQETAEKAAEDFRKAANLLPINWDETVAGKKTLGKNQLRINKIMALGYLGKNLLWAGSPLMNKESTGISDYNKDFCRRSAEAFGELLDLVERGKTQYALVPFEKYSSLFYTNKQSWLMPGSTEAIFRGPSYDPNGSNFGLAKQYTPMIIGESGVISSATANYVGYYGMKNGLPLSDSNSGFDKEYPWRDRDPRFYHDIIFDGVKCVQGTVPSPEEGKRDPEWDRYANLYTNGSYRDVSSGSRTGYMIGKFIPKTANKFDKGWDYGNANHIHLSWMRLADIYLMYAEATAVAYDSPKGKSNNFDKTAVDAINTVRARAGVGEVSSQYIGSTNLFLEELRRERAVELAFESHRFNDLRRWLLLSESPYTIKTSQEFIRAGSWDEQNENPSSNPEFNIEDPSLNRVIGFREQIILERKFTSKHYWLPLKNSDVNMYEDFPQNPGW